jgi:hypothetical protein
VSCGTCPLGEAATCLGFGPACPSASCVTRARWSPEERARFDRQDDAAFLFEASLNRLTVLGLDLPPARAGERPSAAEVARAITEQRRRRGRHPAVIAPGTRFGDLTVLRATRRWNRPAWEVECACGTRNVVESHTLLTERRRSCRACAGRETSLDRAKRIGGELVSELASRAGVSTFSIRQRIRLGWPVEKLAAPRQTGRAA